MSAAHKPATALPLIGDEYMIDQYGYIYRMEPDQQGAHSVVVASVSVPPGRNNGSAKEASKIIAKANAYPKLVEALRDAVKFCPVPTQDKMLSLLRELGEPT